MLYFLAFFGRVFISNSQIFLGSKWQFCFSTGKGKMLENFSQNLWTSVLHTSTWIFLGMLQQSCFGVLVHTTSFCPYPSFFVVFSLLQLNSYVLVQVTSLIVFFLHVAIGSLHVAALVVILGGGVIVVSGVAHPVLPCKAPLDLVSLLESLVMDSLHEVTDQLVHIEADAFNIGL